MKTINTFIKELQAISPDKRELPLVIDINKMEFDPTIKMRWDNPLEMLQKAPDKMVITINNY